jgi:hypothetical protein
MPYLVAGPRPASQPFFIPQSSNPWDSCEYNSLVSYSQNIVCEHLNVTGCGDGIRVPILGNATVRDCNCEGNNSFGIYISSGVVAGCKADNNGYGIYVFSGWAQISDCYVRNNTGSGIFINNSFISGDGAITITGNTCINNGNLSYLSANIMLFAYNCRVENNHVQMGGGQRGIVVNYDVGALNNSINNIIIKNSVTGNLNNNYVIPTGNVLGPILNDSTGAITNSSPWGNFSF